MSVEIKNAFQKIIFPPWKRPACRTGRGLGGVYKIASFLKTKNFLSKKFLFMFFAVAVVATIGASVPAHQAQAGWFSLDIFDSLTKWVTGGMMSDNMLTKIFYGVIVSLEEIALGFAAILVYFGAWLIDVMLEPSLYVGDPGHVPPIPGILNSQAVNIGWTTVRDMCNTFFIFFLLLIAFAMILRVQKFGSTKTLLVKFIMSIFLINFSMVIAKIVIDVGQVFMYEIVTWMPGGFQGKAGSLTSIVEGFKLQLSDTTKATFADVVSGGFAIIYTIMLGLIYIMLAGFLLVRLVMFAILIILSPFAFLSLVLPSMSKYTNEWFDSLVKNSLVGPVFLFFVFLSATMANELVGQPFAHPSTSNIKDISAIVIIIIPNVVALCMLYAVIPVTQKLGAAGSKQLIGGTAGLGKIAMGTMAGVKLAGGLGKKVGAPVARRTGLTDRYRTAKSSALQKISENKLAQNIGLGKSAAQTNAADFKQQRAEVDKNKGWAKQGSPESRWAALQAGNKSSTETAAVIEVMLEKKEINKEDAEAHGIKEKKLDDMLIRAKPAMDADKLKESMPHWAAITELGGSKDKEAVDKRTVKMTTELVSEGKLGSLNKAAKQDATVINTIEKEHDNFDGWAGSQSKTDRKAIATGLMENAEIATANGDDEEALKFKTKAAKAGMELQKAFESCGKSASEAAEDIAKVFNKFDAKRVAQFSDEELRNHGHSATSSQSRAIHRAGKEEKNDIIKKSKEVKEGTYSTSAKDGADDYQTAIERLEAEKRKTSPDQSKINDFNDTITRLKGSADVQEIINLRKGRENIDSMVSGEKF